MALVDRDDEFDRLERALAHEQAKTRADQELDRLRDLQAQAQKERDAANAKLAEAKELLGPEISAAERRVFDSIADQAVGRST